MSFRYFHDSHNKRVYRMPSAPEVVERKDRRGKRTGWVVWAEIDVTRADNVMSSRTRQWTYPTTEVPRQEFSSADTRAFAVEYFFKHHTPQGEKIDEETYERLRQEYEAEALNRKT